MSEINKIQVGDKKYNISGTVVSYSEPEGEDRLPLWICPTNKVDDIDYDAAGNFTGYANSSSGSKELVYWFAVSEEGAITSHVGDVYTSDAQNWNGGYNQAQAAAAEHNIGYIVSKSFTYSTPDMWTAEPPYEVIINNFEKFLIKPNTRYEIYQSSPVVGSEIRAYWFDKNGDYISTYTEEIIASDLVSNYHTFAASPNNALYCFFIVPSSPYYSSMMGGSTKVSFVEHIDGERAEQGVYILNEENDTYYKQGNI